VIADFDSLTSDGCIVTSTNVEYGELIDESLPIRYQALIGSSIEDAHAAHRELVKSCEMENGTETLTIEPDEISAVDNYAHRIMGWSMYRTGYVKSPPPPIPRFEPRADPKAASPCLHQAG